MTADGDCSVWPPPPNLRVVPSDPVKLPLCDPPELKLIVPLWISTAEALLKATPIVVEPAPADFRNTPELLLLNAGVPLNVLMLASF